MKTIITIILVLSFITLCSQKTENTFCSFSNTEIVVNSKLKFKKLNSELSSYEYIGYKLSDSSLLLGFSNDSVSIDQKHKWDLKIDGVKHQFCDIYVQRWHVFILTFAKDKDANEELKLYFTKFNIKTEQFESPHEVTERFDRSKPFDYEIEFSENRENVLIFKNDLSLKYKSGIQFTGINMKLGTVLLGEAWWLRDGPKGRNVWRKTISNNGDISFLLVDHVYKSHYASHSNYLLWVYSKKNEKPYEFDVSVPNNKMTDNSMFISHENGDLELFCWYGKKGNKPIGTFNLKIDGISHKETFREINPFSYDMAISATNSKKQHSKIKKQQLALKGIVISNAGRDVEIFTNMDGSMFLITEEKSAIENESASSMHSASPSYRTGDISIIKLDSSRSFIWGTLIEKFTYSDIQLVNSYQAYLNIDGGIGLVYSKSSSEDQLTMIFISSDGIVSDEYLLSKNTENSKYVEKATNITNDEFIYGNSIKEILKKISEL